MVKAAVALIGFVAVLTATASVQRGCRDVQQALTELRYHDKRDMRSTVALLPQQGFYRLPDSVGVPTVGREIVLDRETAAARLVNPIPVTDSTIVWGERKYQRLCMPCHGKTLKGDGPVAPKFIPATDLLSQTTRERKDGYLYSYIRHGGAVMPSYGAQVTVEEAWYLIHYIRNLQRTSPR